MQLRVMGTIDKTAYDRSDDFGLPPKEITGAHCWFSPRRMTVMVAVTLAIVGAVIDALVVTSHPASGMATILGTTVQYSVFAGVMLGVTQLFYAFGGIVAIVAANQKFWPKTAPGTRGRIVFDLTKWCIVVVLMISDAYFLEQAYEMIFIPTVPS